MKILRPMLACVVAPLCLMCSLPAFSKCLDTGVQLQILGSGGPGAAGGRASSGYLLWVDGVSRIMVDAGSGTKDQFHRSGANSDDIEFVALSHLHPDHSAELPAIFWPAGGSFDVSGPSGAGEFPAIEEFLSIMFGANGAYRAMGPRLELDVITVDATTGATDVWSEDNILVSGTGVPHGDVPTIAYRFEFGETSIVFASDQNGSDPEFIEFAQGADYLVIHMAVPEDATGVMAQLHATPSVWGAMATAADAGRLVVSHISAATPQALDESVAILRTNYAGPLSLSEDLMCIELL
jgi:ribonuclease BN (tRNA processing enzyme)